MKNVYHIDAGEITDWDSFHTVFHSTLGFPDYYGRNMNAWIDCMTYLDEVDLGMTNVGVEPGELFVLTVGGAYTFSERCPEQFNALVECSAFVNHRRMELGDPAVLALVLA